MMERQTLKKKCEAMRNQKESPTSVRLDYLSVRMDFNEIYV